MAQILYGIEDDEDIHQLMVMIEEAQEGIARGLLPGKLLVEFFPFLRHIPEWFPGAEFKRLSRKWVSAAMQLKNAPFVKFKESMVSAHVVGSLGSK